MCSLVLVLKTRKDLKGFKELTKNREASMKIDSVHLKIELKLFRFNLG